MGVDFLTRPISDNYDEVRGRTLSTNKSISRDTSMSSTRSSVVYHKRMVHNNLKDKDDSTSELSYETEQERALRISKAAKQQEYTRTKDGNIETTAVYSTEDKGIINIQLPYNPQALTKLDLWSGSFYSISLYSSIKHITSNTKNIKDFLNLMARYITNK